MPFSRGSSQPKDRTQVCHTAGGSFILWATREAPTWLYSLVNIYSYLLTTNWVPRVVLGTVQVSVKTQTSSANFYNPDKYGQRFLGGSMVRNPAANAGDEGSIPGSGRCPGEGKGHPLQYSCLGSPTDRGAWWARVYSSPGSSVHGVLQERILKWVAMPSSRGSSWPRNWTCVS